MQLPAGGILTYAAFPNRIDNLSYNLYNMNNP